MKKSKVLIPAMALLLFSTAASITGTVAWFTSNRVFESQLGDFKVGNLEGSLECVATAGIATGLNGNNITISENYILGDASFDHTSEKVFTDVPGSDPTSFIDLGGWSLKESGEGSNSSLLYGSVSSTKYYYCATWKYTFSYTFVAEAGDMNLYFDIAKANTAAGYKQYTGTVEGEALDTAQGFRLGFCTSEAQVVWAPHRAQSGSNPATIRHVKDGSPDAVADYTGSVLLDSAATADLGQPTDAKAKSVNGYLGTFSKPVDSATGAARTISLEVRMTAWYEGTDPSITTRNDTAYQKVKAKLPFVVRPATGD